MKLLLVLLVAFTVAVDALKCPPEVWGCMRGLRKKSYKSKHQHSKVKLRVQRDDGVASWRKLREDFLQNNVPCLTDDAECRAKIQELWERARSTDEGTSGKAMDEKRQLDCPFGVWGCKKREFRRVLRKEKPVKRECASGECDNGDMNDLIEELFTES